MLDDDESKSDELKDKVISLQDAAEQRRRSRTAGDPLVPGSAAPDRQPDAMNCAPALHGRPALSDGTGNGQARLDQRISSQDQISCINVVPLHPSGLPAPYAALWCKSNYSFLEGASHPEELVQTATALGLQALALTDRDG